MNGKLVSGGTALEIAEREVAQRERQHSLALKKQRKEKKKLKAVVEQKDDEVLMLNNQYASVQEELNAARMIIKKLNVKLEQA